MKDEVMQELEDWDLFNHSKIWTPLGCTRN